MIRIVFFPSIFKYSAHTALSGPSLTAENTGLGSGRSNNLNGNWLRAARPFSFQTAALAAGERRRPRAECPPPGREGASPEAPPEEKNVCHVSPYLRQVMCCMGWLSKYIVCALVGSG